MNKITILNNKKAKIELEDQAIFNKLRNHFSFKLKGVEYSPAYQQGWTGITYMIDKKGLFLSGLVPKVKQYLKNKHIKFEEEDLREPITVEPEYDIADKLKELGMEPREHQKAILNAALANRKGIIRSCTGSGKTLATALITAKLNKSTNIYVIGIDLLQQFHNLFSKLFNEKIGFVGDGICDIQRINIISIWSVGNALKLSSKEMFLDDEIGNETNLKDIDKLKLVKALKDAKVHILDESHVCSTVTVKHIFNAINPEYIYGFSGTPFREDNTDLLIHGVLGDEIINVSASELINLNLLAQPLIKFIPVPHKSISNIDNYQTVYKEFVVENEIRNNLIIKNLKELIQKKYSPLVLFKQINHGKILYKMMQDENIKVGFLYGNDTLERREEIKKQFNNGEVDVILASTIFDIGIDIPKINALILTSSGRSKGRSLQRIGRCLRSFPGKKYAAIIEFYDSIKFLKKHAMIRYETYCSEPGFKVFPCKEMIKK